jgi:hypothetical protein
VTDLSRVLGRRAGQWHKHLPWAGSEVLHHNCTEHCHLLHSVTFTRSSLELIAHHPSPRFTPRTHLLLHIALQRMRNSVRPLPSRMTKVGSADCFTPAYTPPMLPSPTHSPRSARQLPLRLRTDPTQRDRSRSRRRSRSPRRSRRSYDSRSRSRSRDNYRRDERRSRSPVNGSSAAAPAYQANTNNNNAYPSNREGSAAAPAPRNFEERVVAKEQMMQNVREHSQQDRRVYVGNLSYDVKWHHLKDFMRQGEKD